MFFQNVYGSSFSIKLTNPVSLGKIKYWQEDEQYVSSGFGIEYYPSQDSKLGQAMDIMYRALEAFDRAANEVLLANVDEYTVITTFKFPKGTETFCQQYLIYFSQFLSDLGIENSTEITQQLNETLFKVIPKNEEESLQKNKVSLRPFFGGPHHEELRRRDCKSWKQHSNLSLASKHHASKKSI